MPELVCLGEMMLRLSTPHHLRFSQADRFVATIGGAEANVAVAVAQFGGSAGYVTRLPDNDLAERALRELRGLNVDVSCVVRGGDRLGVYFIEHGASLRSSKVIYDRAHSAMAEALPEHFNWATLLEGARWFHWSGITPALSAKTAEVCLEACKEAQSRGVTVSFDVNYRGKLWTQAKAGKVLAPLMQYVDVCITSAEEVREIFGLQLPDGPDRTEAAARGLVERFGFKKVALTSRVASTADATEWGASLFADGKLHHSRRYQVRIVDRLGAGDCFSGALLFALMRGDDSAAALEFSVAASTLKHTVYGDYCQLTTGEVDALLAGGTGGRVQR